MAMGLSHRSGALTFNVQHEKPTQKKEWGINNMYCLQLKIFT